MEELATLADCTRTEYQRNFERRHAVEKVVELVVGYAIDINHVIIEAAGDPPPQTYYNTFLEMERLGFIPASLMPRLASATGLRNRLVHRYEDIDNETMYYSLKPLLRNYRRYAGIIEEYLQAAESRRSKGTKKKK